MAATDTTADHVLEHLLKRSREYAYADVAHDKPMASRAQLIGALWADSWSTETQGAVWGAYQQAYAVRKASPVTSSTRVFKLDGFTVTVTAEDAPGQRAEPPGDGYGRGKPSTVGLDRVIMHVLTSRDTAMFAPEEDRDQRHLTCWAGGLAYILSTYLRRYLGGAVRHNDPMETK